MKKRMYYTMIIKGDRLAIARARGCEGSLCIPVSYAYDYMQDVSRIAKSENIEIVWTVIFE